MAELRGFANWPAILPTLTIGTCAAYVKTTAMESRGAKLALDVRRGHLGEGLRAVAALQHEGLTGRHAGHLGAQLVALGGKDQGWEGTKLADHVSKIGG